MKSYLSTFAIYCAAITAYAQSDDRSAYDQDLGFNTYFVLSEIFQSGQTPFVVMYKKYKDENHAMRLGADVYVSIANSDVSRNTSTHRNEKYLSFSFSIGKEIQSHLSTHWVWYYGGDLVPAIRFEEVDYYQTRFSIPEHRSVSSKELGLALRPFIGLRYDISNRLYLSAEAQLSFFYRRSSFIERQVDRDFTLQDLRTTRFGLSLTPASGIFVFYRF